MDGSTDSANIDDEIFLILWCDVDCEDQLIHTNMSDAEGLYDCLEGFLRRIGIQAISSDYCKMMIGIGTD